MSRCEISPSYPLLTTFSVWCWYLCTSSLLFSFSFRKGSSATLVEHQLHIMYVPLALHHTHTPLSTQHMYIHFHIPLSNNDSHNTQMCKFILVLLVACIACCNYVVLAQDDLTVDMMYDLSLHFFNRDSFLQGVLRDNDTAYVFTQLAPELFIINISDITPDLQQGDLKFKYPSRSSLLFFYS